MRRPRRTFPSLRRRLFVSTVVVVIASIGIALAVGILLTRRAVERANLSDLSHQADLLAQREMEDILPLSKLKRLQPFLTRQNEVVEVVDLARPSPFLPDRDRLAVRTGEAVQGTVTVEGKRYFFAARNVQGRGFVLLRPASLRTSDWWPFLQGLLLASLVGLALAALGSFVSARAIARPVRRVAEASRTLAGGVSPDPVPVEGSVELASLATSFNEMAAELQRAREAERSFLLSVSHELKTPLTAIRGYAEGLEEGAFEPAEAAVTIRQEARRLERLVGDLLDLARMNRSEFAIHRQEIDLADVAREAVRRHEAEARACGVELEAIVSGPAPAEGDLDRVLQVVSNLVENALRSTPPGGLVRLRAAPGLLHVEDTGVGIAPEDLPHAFERFYLYDRYDRNPDGRRLGSGLGLAIVKELVERMGGSVSVESRLGQGTTFAVRLPLSGRTADPRRRGSLVGQG
ncbi:MAG: two-component sensor histidine kinase [Thermoleophilia bacterium]